MAMAVIFQTGVARLYLYAESILPLHIHSKWNNDNNGVHTRSFRGCLLLQQCS